MSWRIEYEGYTLRERDVTSGELAIVSQLAEATGWEALHPSGSPRVLLAWIALTVAKGMGQSLEEVLSFITTRPIAPMIAAIKDDPDDVPAMTPDGPMSAMPTDMAAFLADLKGA